MALSLTFFRGFSVGFGLSLGILLVPGAARADGDDDAEPAKQSDADADFGHRGQFGIRAGLAGGYRMVLRYDSSPYCATPEELERVYDVIVTFLTARS